MSEADTVTDSSYRFTGIATAACAEPPAVTSTLTVASSRPK